MRRIFLNRIFSSVAILSVTVPSWLLTAYGQTGGRYDLSHAVIASGGGSDSTGITGGQTFKAEGTIGQGVAGASSNSSPPKFDLHGGFWFQNSVPTAATVTISGRVTTADGQGIRNARLTISSADGETRTVVTTAFGFYRFTDVEVGRTYVIQISSKRFMFATPARVISVVDEVTNLDFVAVPG